MPRGVLARPLSAGAARAPSRRFPAGLAFAYNPLAMLRQLALASHFGDQDGPCESDWQRADNQTQGTYRRIMRTFVVSSVAIAGLLALMALFLL